MLICFTINIINTILYFIETIDVIVLRSSLITLNKQLYPYKLDKKIHFHVILFYVGFEIFTFTFLISFKCCSKHFEDPQR